MQKKTRFIGVMVGILMLMLYGCSSTQDINIEEQLFDGEGGEGRPRVSVWFQLLSSNNEGLVGVNDLLLETPQDEIVLTIGTTSNTHLPVMVKVFYNYEEIPFLVGGEGDYVTQFLFELYYGNQTDFSFSLSSELEANESFNALTIGVFAHPDHLSKNDDHFEINTDFGAVLNFRVSYGGEENLVLPVPYQDLPEQIAEMFHRGVMINQDSAALTIEYSDGGVFTMYPNPLQVAPNEVVNFYFYANLEWTDEIESMENYLIISMLDWQQIEKNGQPYLLMEARFDDMVNDVMDHGRFTVTMPSEPGFYEFVTFVVPDPTSFNVFLMSSPLELSFPFTVEVVE